MPKPAAPSFKPLVSWSFSRWSDYRKCPALFCYKHLQKLKEPPNPAMERGSAIHKLAEEYTLGRLKKLPKELELFKDEFAELKKQKIKFVEESWSFRKDWTLTEYDDWNHCWLRVKTDAAYVHPKHNVLVVIDHKTGKPRPEKTEEYELQLELYGLAGLEQQPEIDLVSPRLWYLDVGEIYPNPEEREIEYLRADQKELRKKWEARVAPMFKDTQFKPKPGDACRWCHYRKSNGGPCKY